MRVNPRCRVLTEAQAAYLAGLIDGEGYVGVTRAETSRSARTSRRGVSYRAMVSVAMTDRRPLDYGHQATGVGTIRARKMGPRDRRQAYNWNIWSQQATDLLAQLRPHLIVKAELADIVAEFQALMRFPGPAGLTDEEWDKREQLWLATKQFTYGKEMVA